MATTAADTILGTDGADLVHGLAGDDLIGVSLGLDTLYGDEGNDTLNGLPDSYGIFDGSPDALFGARVMTWSISQTPITAMAARAGTRPTSRFGAIPAT